ncbi:MAG: septal ring lytic transglycosylase RlpA family protein [Leptolyngbyaceae cyanobacterium CSU_1_3]|nr:septal ring lytic transglycosylase RlpA family protein [Leptolyngbyaceae cyanobacterium CSU_1_3]
MSIIGLIWVASWFGDFSSIAEKLLETPKYLSHVLLGQMSSSIDEQSDSLESNLYAPLNSGRSSYWLNIAAPVGFNSPSNFGLISPPPQQPTTTSLLWAGAIEGVLFGTAPQQSASESQLESSFHPVADHKSRQEASGNPLNDLAQAVQDFFSGIPKIAVDLEGEAVVMLRAGSEQSNRLTRTGFWRCASQESLSEDSDGGNFQIWVKGCLVAEVPNRDDAKAIAHSLQALLKTPNLDASQLQPGVALNGPSAKLGDRVLFTLDSDRAAQFNRPAELVAIAWINNLRVALGEAPLSLAEAQIQMHGLKNTDGSITGMASWYGPYFHGRETATGETFDQNELTAAHPTLPFDTYLKVTNLLNGKSVVVRINDRGPYFDNRVLDLSNRAARCIGSEDKGVVPIEATIMQPTFSANVALR